jgi:hypothetical protein
LAQQPELRQQGKRLLRPLPPELTLSVIVSNSSSTFSFSPDIIGSPLASGALVAPCRYGMVAGAIYVYNSSGATKRYYLWANMNQFNTTCGAYNFATTSWGEN